MRDSFTIKQAVEITQIPRERLKAWLLRGYIRPSIAAGVGPGRSNLYSRVDLYAIALFDYLVSKKRLHRNPASMMIRRLYQELPSTIEKAEKSDQVLIAFIDRPIGEDLMIRRGGDVISDDGQVISGKAQAPGVRIMIDEDLEKGFRTLFVTFDDTQIPRKFDLSGVGIRDIIIIDFKDLKRRIDERLR